MNLTQHHCGYLIETDSFVAFFGNKNSNLEELKKSFPEFRFLRTKQTHSDISIVTDLETSDYTLEADAQVTEALNLALCSITADCIPILVYSPLSKKIAAIHSGWRGVENKIAVKTLQRHFTAEELPSCQLFIGPHVHQNSFVCDLDVKDRLVKSAQLEFVTENDIFSTHNINGVTKFKVNLLNVLISQIHAVGIDQDNLQTLYIDTYTDERFHSYRRDHEKAGRQISFILKR